MIRMLLRLLLQAKLWRLNVRKHDVLVMRMPNMSSDGYNELRRALIAQGVDEVLFIVLGPEEEIKTLGVREMRENGWQPLLKQ